MSTLRISKIFFLSLSLSVAASFCSYAQSTSIGEIDPPTGIRGGRSGCECLARSDGTSLYDSEDGSGDDNVNNYYSYTGPTGKSCSGWRQGPDGPEWVDGVVLCDSNIIDGSGNSGGTQDDISPPDRITDGIG